jgi:pimeloyl-ACP methyl ester carboxylesterase
MLAADTPSIAPPRWEPTDVIAGDGARLRSYAVGPAGRPVIVIASACGMPVQLCEHWLAFLAADYRVLTWETRGLFGDLGRPAAFDQLGHGLADQAADLLAVLDHHGANSAHFMGLCGGAVIALRAAAEQPGRASSLSLWHGDFSGSPGPTTSHQENLKALMAIASQSREDAEAISAALSQAATAAVPPELTDLVSYPYGNPELFYRYCVLTGATMSTDVSELLGTIGQPALVVTSEDDHTAHPGGSHGAAGALPRAVLEVEPHGDHLSAFGAGARLRHLMTSFLNGQGKASHG